MTALTDEQCCEVVREALDSLSAEIGEQLRDVAVIVEDSHPNGQGQIRELGYG